MSEITIPASPIPSPVATLSDIQSFYQTIEYLERRIQALEQERVRDAPAEETNFITPNWSTVALGPTFSSSTPSLNVYPTPEAEFIEVRHGPSAYHASCNLNTPTIALTNRFEALADMEDAQEHEPAHDPPSASTVHESTQQERQVHQHPMRRGQAQSAAHVQEPMREQVQEPMRGQVQQQQEPMRQQQQPALQQQRPTPREQVPARERQQEPERQTHLQQDAAATRVPITLVVSDSMCAGIRNAPLNEMLNAHSISPDSESVHVEKHLGATAEQLRYYSKYNIQLLKPDTVVVVAGANDVSNELSKPNPDHQQIANRIIEIARDAKQLGVAEVHVLGIVSRRDKRYATLISRTNIALRLLSLRLSSHRPNN